MKKQLWDNDWFIDWSRLLSEIIFVLLQSYTDKIIDKIADCAGLQSNWTNIRILPFLQEEFTYWSWPLIHRDITCPRVDANFIFECSTRYLTSERSERVGYWVEHERIIFVSKSGHVIFCLFYKHTKDDVFDDFPKISDHFRKISENFLKLFRRPDEHFRTFSEHFPKITEDCRKRTKKIRRCFYHTLTNLSVVKGTKEKCYQKGMISSQCER